MNAAGVLGRDMSGQTIIMTGQRDNMDNQPSLLSSKLLLNNRQVEVLLSRASLTWKEIRKCKEGLYSVIFGTGKWIKNYFLLV